MVLVQGRASLFNPEDNSVVSTEQESLNALDGFFQASSSWYLLGHTLATKQVSKRSLRTTKCPLIQFATFLHHSVGASQAR